MAFWICKWPGERETKGQSSTFTLGPFEYLNIEIKCVLVFLCQLIPAGAPQTKLGDDPFADCPAPGSRADVVLACYQNLFKLKQSINAFVKHFWSMNSKTSLDCWIDCVGL